MVYIKSSFSIYPDASASEEQPFMSASEPDYKSIITDANLRRRMSRVVKMGVACGLKCIGTSDPKSIGGIITGTGLGCLADTEKFMDNLLDNEEQLLNPTPFIQSTFNTVGSQIALIKGIRAYNMTHVHRSLSFGNVLIDAFMRLEDEEEDKDVLVGAFDELTPASYAICQRLGMYKLNRAGEGATFFLLSSTPPSGPGPKTNILIHSIDNRDVPEGIVWELLVVFSNQGFSSLAIDYLITNANESQLSGEVYSVLKEKLPDTVRCSFFKEQYGEYPTVLAHAIWQAEQLLQEEEIALIYNYTADKHHSFILLYKEP